MLEQAATANLFRLLEEFLFLYGRTVYEHVAGAFLSLFMTFYAIKFIWDIAKKSALKGDFTPEDFFKPLLIVTIVSVLLGSSVYVEEWMVQPFYKMATHLSTMTASLTKVDLKEINIIGMLDVVDKRLNQVVFKPCSDLLGTLGVMNMHLILGVLVIECLFIFVWFLFLALMIESIFRFMTFYAVSPLLIPALAFPMTKQVGIAGLRSLLHGILTMFLAGVAMGLTVAVLSQSGLISFENDSISPKWVFSDKYWTLVLTGLVSIMFHLKAPKIAANLANIDDGPGAAAAVAGLGTGALMIGKSAALGAARRGIGAVGQGLGAIGRQAGNNLSAPHTAAHTTGSYRNNVQALYDKVTKG